jgi:hypothetical protein
MLTVAVGHSDDPNSFSAITEVLEGFQFIFYPIFEWESRRSRDSHSKIGFYLTWRALLNGAVLLLGAA